MLADNTLGLKWLPDGCCSVLKWDKNLEWEKKICSVFCVWKKLSKSRNIRMWRWCPCWICACVCVCVCVVMVQGVTCLESAVKSCSVIKQSLISTTDNSVLELSITESSVKNHVLVRQNKQVLGWFKTGMSRLSWTLMFESELCVRAADLTSGVGGGGGGVLRSLRLLSLWRINRCRSSTFHYALTSRTGGAAAEEVT